MEIPTSRISLEQASERGSPGSIPSAEFPLGSSAGMLMQTLGGPNQSRMSRASDTHNKLQSKQDHISAVCKIYRTPEP